jgi:hypothetical protein
MRVSLRAERGQVLVALAGAAVVLLLFVGVLGALGKALLGRGRLQRAADLAARGKRAPPPTGLLLPWRPYD